MHEGTKVAIHTTISAMVGSNIVVDILEFNKTGSYMITVNEECIAEGEKPYKIGSDIYIKGIINAVKSAGKYDIDVFTNIKGDEPITTRVTFNKSLGIKEYEW